MKSNSLPLVAFGVVLTLLWTFFFAGGLAIFEGYPLALRPRSLEPSVVVVGM